VRLADLELLQQGQARAAREGGSRSRKNTSGRRASGRRARKRCATRRSARSRSFRTAEGPLCESQAIVEYLEAGWPEPPLLPKEHYAAAKVRELTIFVDLHLELVARELYPKAFFGGSLDADDAARLKTLLTRNIAAFKRLARFDPLRCRRATSRCADCAAWASLPVVAMATKAIYGEDLLAAGGVEIKGYQRFVGERRARSASLPIARPGRNVPPRKADASSGGLAAGLGAAARSGHRCRGGAIVAIISLR
jgi:glutathione S-transferase